ncbi:MAG TPA: hypothetical protein VM513_10440 [Kofleriaceae bacterium]|nr:hypothetical protein [Kofleriaceae bacterium]
MKLDRLTFFIALVACDRTSDRVVVASDQECIAYYDRIAALVDNTHRVERAINPLLVGYCKRRGMTSAYVECIVRSPTLDDAERCRPRTDPRPAGQRPDVSSCDALTAHIDKLVAGLS